MCLHVHTIDCFSLPWYLNIDVWEYIVWYSLFSILFGTVCSLHCCLWKGIFKTKTEVNVTVISMSVIMNGTVISMSVIMNVTVINIPVIWIFWFFHVWLVCTLNTHVWCLIIIQLILSYNSVRNPILVGWNICWHVEMCHNNKHGLK
jgi:hypothetical protein